MSSDPIVVTPAGGGDRSRAKKLLVVAAVVFVATLVWPRITSGGDEVEDFSEFPTVAPSPAPAPAPALEDVRVLGATRDPFRALVAAAPGDQKSSAPAPAPVVEPVPVIAPEPLAILPPFPVPAPTPAPAPVPTTVAPAPTPAPTTTTTIDPRKLRKFSLFSVGMVNGKETARIGIDDATLQVVEGERFWSDYRVVSLDIDAMCGVFEFRGKGFALCHGESTRT